MDVKEKEFLVEDLTLTKLRDWMNEYYGEKKTGTPFQIADVQAYTIRGNIPNYLGGNEVILNNTIKGVKLYSIKTEENGKD